LLNKEIEAKISNNSIFKNLLNKLDINEKISKNINSNKVKTDFSFINSNNKNNVKTLNTSQEYIMSLNELNIKEENENTGTLTDNCSDI